MFLTLLPQYLQHSRDRSHNYFHRAFSHPLFLVPRGHRLAAAPMSHNPPISSKLRISLENQSQASCYQGEGGSGLTRVLFESCSEFAWATRPRG